MPKRDYIRAESQSFPRKVLKTLRRWCGLARRVLHECGALDSRIQQRKSSF
jgi:hypothetical protein